MEKPTLLVPDADLLRQLAGPHGPHAEAVARYMNEGNRRLNRRAVQALEVGTRHRVLEVGFGGGVGIEELLAGRAGLRVVGIDPSSAMVHRPLGARRPGVAGDRVRIVRGAVESLPFPAASFDRILAVNTVYFWRDLEVGLAELGRVLKPDGRVVFGKRSEWALRAARLGERGYRLLTAQRLGERLPEHGFRDVCTSCEPDPVGGDLVLVSARAAPAPGCA